MQLTYIGPFDAVEIPDVGVVEQGQSIDVPDELAGRAPVPGQIPAGLVTLFEAEGPDAIVALDEEALAAFEDDELVDVLLDPGEGLLAQPSNWVEASDGLDPLTIKQLLAVAEERGVDLADLGAKPKKPAIIAAIRAHQED